LAVRRRQPCRRKNVVPAPGGGLARPAFRGRGSAKPEKGVLSSVPTRLTRTATGAFRSALGAGEPLVRGACLSAARSAGDLFARHHRAKALRSRIAPERGTLSDVVRLGPRGRLYLRRLVDDPGVQSPRRGIVGARTEGQGPTRTVLRIIQIAPI